jgi:hypothetical protein
MPLTRPVSVPAAASARNAPVMLAPFSSILTLPRLAFLSLTVASPPDTMYGRLDSTSILKWLSPWWRSPSSCGLA